MGLTAEAKITKASVKPGTDGYSAKAPQLVLEVSIDMPAMKPVPTFEAWSAGDRRRYDIARTMRDCRNAAKPQPPARPKGAKDCEECDGWIVKGKEHAHVWSCEECDAEFAELEKRDEHERDCDGGYKACEACGKRIPEEAYDGGPDFCACEAAQRWCCEKHEKLERSAWRRVRRRRAAVRLVRRRARRGAAVSAGTADRGGAMTDDLAARLDYAIEAAQDEARSIMQGCAMREDFPCTCSGALDRYAALVAVRARLDEARLIGPQNAYTNRTTKLEAEAERLLSGEAG